MGEVPAPAGRRCLSLSIVLEAGVIPGLVGSSHVGVQTCGIGRRTLMKAEAQIWSRVPFLKSSESALGR